MKKIRVRFKLWLSTPAAEGVFGDGKWRLLRAIDEKGSLSAASNALGISYRKAWGDLNKAEKTLNVALVDRKRGGSRGGRTGLTPEGEKWVKAYTRFRGEIERAAEMGYERHIGELLQ